MSFIEKLSKMKSFIYGYESTAHTGNELEVLVTRSNELLVYDGAIANYEDATVGALKTIEIFPEPVCTTGSEITVTGTINGFTEDITIKEAEALWLEITADALNTGSSTNIYIQYKNSLGIYTTVSSTAFVLAAGNTSIFRSTAFSTFPNVIIPGTYRIAIGIAAAAGEKFTPKYCHNPNKISIA